MNPEDRIARWLDDLISTLDGADDLAARGRGAFDADPALPLAFEALANRIGDLSKRLSAADRARFSAPIWSQAAKNRDFVVHHYDRVDVELLWVTVTAHFPELRDEANRVRDAVGDA
ncbi:HepT-like ribonuclease domain-containing protein [Agromyces archimandritae]|uniref:DUF86 domain-containing protein n=1 Tax=Agromyces archimandritae TaxID=2781962 RepID=A0A975FP83_9MICO|nr:HepT-like ribonuclease domain-containing protein [Agromyces archimandritae]QTX05128.1 DUF86 domain-containing protein [Agromyces archimandritae]